jgi:hypothetical protein
VHTRAAWVIAVLTACLAWSAPAGAAQVQGSLTVTEVTASSVSFTVTAQRTCVTNEQCDYYADLEEVEGEGACPAAYPADPWNAWNGAVLNTGPSTESGTITPRGWLSKVAVAPSRLCLYIYAERAYYLAGGTTITRPGTVGDGGGAPPPGDGTPTIPGFKPKAPVTPGTSGTAAPTSGASTPKLTTCAGYRYQQSAQKALDANPALASGLDHNRNGVACQGLAKRKTYVRTVGVAAAGTSTRAALRRAYGKAFTQGTGYKAQCARRSRTRVRCTVSWQHKGTWAGSVDVVGALRKNEPVVLTQVKVQRP